MMWPAWHVAPDFGGDQTAHKEVCAEAVEAAQVHRAARHHNWTQSSPVVQAWTQGDHKKAETSCNEHRWTAPAAGKAAKGIELVTHVALSRLRNSDLKQRILADRSDGALLKRAASAWHQEFSASRPGWALWFGESDDVDAGLPFGPATVHAAVAALGMWHFGLLPANEDGAVMRVTYRVDEKVPLFKPDWRHGFPNFYFACAASVADAGRTRDLRDGKLRCKEWIVRVDSLQPADHLLDAQCIIPDAAHCHHDLPLLYWQTLATEIRRVAGPAA